MGSAVTIHPSIIEENTGINLTKESNMLQDQQPPQVEHLNAPFGDVKLSRLLLALHHNICLMFNGLCQLSHHLCPIVSPLGLGNISILSFIVIFKCNDKSISKRFFSIVVSPAQYYR